MRGQIGLWEAGLDVGFTPSMLAWLDGQKTGRRVSLQVTRVERTSSDHLTRTSLSVTITPDPEGVKVSPCGAERALEHHARFEYACAKSKDQLELLRDLPRFRLHEVTFLADGLNYGVSATLDDAHLLPWPRLVDCKSYEVPEVLKRDLTLRLKAALLAGGKRFGAHMPDALRERMPSGTHKAALEAARAAIEEMKRVNAEEALTR